MKVLSIFKNNKTKIEFFFKTTNQITLVETTIYQYRN